MTVYSVPDLVTGLDAELYKVGRPVVGPQATNLIDHIHHQFCWNRKARFSWSAQWGLGEIGTPTRGVTADEDYEWRYTSGYNTRFLTVTAVTAGKTTGSTNDAGLTVDTTTTVGAQTFARVPNFAALGADPNVAFQIHRWVIPVAGNTLETVAIDQLVTTQLTRIVALRVEELPISVIDTAVDAWAGDLNQFAAATDIVEGTPGVAPAASTAVSTLPVLCQTLRRFHKQVIFSSAQQVSTAVVAVGNIVDLFTKAVPGTRRIDWDIPACVVLPQTAEPARAVVCRVLAKKVGGAAGGVVRFAFTGGNVDVAVALGAAAWTQTAGVCNKATELLSVQGYNTDAGTLTLYNATVEETVEAT